MKQFLERIRYSFWTFIVLYLTFCFTHGIQGGYTASVLTSLEKKFHLTSSLSGLLVTIASIGYFFSALIIPYVFGAKHRVRLFAICMLSTGLCGLLYVIPHFLYTSYDEVFSFSNTTTDSKSSASSYSDLCLETNRNLSECNSKEAEDDSDNSPNYVAMSLFCLSEILHGVAGASLWTVGIAFIDDNASVQLSSKLIGTMFLMRFISPIVAFGLGGIFLSLHHTLKPTSLVPEHPKWLGAWWLGYFICFVVNILICIPTFFIHEKFRRNDSNNTAKQGKTQVPNMPRRMSLYDATINELCQKSLRIIKNPVFTISSIAVSIDCYIYAFYAFLPKYMEVFFMQTSWMASLLGGMVPCLAGGLMCYSGGVISGKFKPGVDQAVSKNVLFSWCMSIMDTILFLLILFIPCSQSYFPVGYDQDSSMVHLNQSCNFECACAVNLYNPICDSDNNWYVSPCHAGCTDQLTINGSNTIYSNCNCIRNEAEATVGMCDQSCVFSLAAYIALLILSSAANNSYNVPLTNVVLKCVDESDKSLALGIQTIFICLTMFPSTMVVGRLLDSTCILWHSNPCSETTGSCLAYDHRRFRLVLHGLTMACRICSTLLYGLNYKIAMTKANQLASETATLKDLVPMNSSSNKIDSLVQRKSDLNEPQNVHA